MVAALSTYTEALDNGLAITPPMGFRTYVMHLLVYIHPRHTPSFQTDLAPCVRRHPLPTVHTGAMPEAVSCRQRDVSYRCTLGLVSGGTSSE